MEYTLVNGELYHYGVPGMKWGVRKKYDYVTVRQAAKNATKARKEAVRELNESPRKHTLAQYTRAANNAHKESIAADKAANRQRRAERKRQINDAYKEVTNNSRLSEKIFFNDATRKKAAKYIVDNNMSMDDAKRKANRVAIANTAAILAAIGGYAIAASHS